MAQDIVCKNGICYENGTIEYELKSITDNKNLAQKIQYELLMNSIK